MPRSCSPAAGERSIVGDAAPVGGPGGVTPGCAPGLPRPRPRSNGEAVAPGAGEIPPAGDSIGVPKAPGLPRPLPRSNGEAIAPGAGEMPGGDPAGVPNAPGLPRPLPRSNGEAVTAGAGETAPAGVPPGATVAPGGTRPGLPFRPGATGAVAAGDAVAPGEAAGEMPAAARPGAGGRVGGGIFLRFSVLNFCFICSALATPAQPCSTFGFATLVFTTRGAIPRSGLLIFWGAAITSLSPCTLVNAPDLTATAKFVAGCRSTLKR